MSLKARITLAALLLALAVLFGAYYNSFKDVETYDESYKFSHMDGQSLILAELWEAAGGGDDAMQPELNGLTEDFFGFTGLAYRIECKDNEFSAESAVFPKFEDPIPDDADYYDTKPDEDGDNWLIINRETKSARVQVGMASEFKMTFWAFIKTRDFLIILGGILLGAILLYFIMGWLLGPIRKLGKAAEGPDLELQTLRSPPELMPLKNLLLGFKDRQASHEKIKSGQLDKERYFTANAAHELLTPLSAIKTEVQLQQRLVEDDDMKSWLGDLLTRVNRATHTVDQLMTLARLDPDKTLGDKAPIDIGMLMGEITEDYTDRMSRKFVTIKQVLSENNTVLAYPGLIETLLRNLISNAVKYTPVEGKIEMRTKTNNGWLDISVFNTCERLPEYLVDQMFDRFVRGPHEVETGSGLGLAISKRIADLHSAELKPEVSPEKESLSFSFSLPLA